MNRTAHFQYTDTRAEALRMVNILKTKKWTEVSQKNILQAI